MSGKEQRVMAYVDGFNLYHSIKSYKPNKLNLHSLFEAISQPHETLVGVKYFSAYADWLPSKTLSHKQYVKDLEGAGVEVILGKYKKKSPRCNLCKQNYQSHEEKQTDVNIALHLLCDAQDDIYDKAKLVTVDSDISAAVKIVKSRFPEKSILIVKPPGRGSLGRELVHATGGSGYVLRKNLVNRHMF